MLKIIFILLFSAGIYSQQQLDVIVLDAGHGGKDPGAIGISGVYEKDINLPITLLLGSMIHDYYPQIKLIYTREDDSFPELKDRTRIANQNQAKLFISIHSNHKKVEDEDKRGFEIYVLNNARFGEAVDITLAENQIIPQLSNSRYDTAAYMLSSLAHNAYLHYAYYLSYNFESYLSALSEIPSRGIYEADFWVLAGASMPSILVECGYLSDQSDETHLRSPIVQEKIAKALFEGFRRYKTWYEMY